MLLVKVLLATVAAWSGHWLICEKSTLDVRANCEMIVESRNCLPIQLFMRVACLHSQFHAPRREQRFFPSLLHSNSEGGQSCALVSTETADTCSLFVYFLDGNGGSVVVDLALSGCTMVPVTEWIFGNLLREIHL